ncbi:MAG: GntR family transcriptional regulator, partial [Pseudomonadota bacterium]
MTIDAATSAPTEALAPTQSATPRASLIAGALEDALRRGALPKGAFIAEEPLAKLFGTSRTPVRAAIKSLAERGLLARTGSRGYAVPGAAPRRVRLTSAMLGLPDGAPGLPPAAAERIAEDFEVALARALPFGSYRINEQAAADHF